MIDFKEIPSYITKKRDSWRSVRDTWLEYGEGLLAKLYSDVEDTHTPYTKKQLEGIDLRTRITASINQLYPIVLQNLALLLEEKPSHKIISTNGVGSDIAQIIDRMKHTVLYDSKSILQSEETTKEMLCFGMGHKMNIEDDESVKNIFKVKNKFVPNRYMIVDPNVMDKSFDDEEGFFIIRTITVESCDREYGEMLDQLPLKSDGTKYTAKDFSGNYNAEAYSYITTDGSVNTVDVTEWWTTKKTTMYIKESNGIIKKLFKENNPEDKNIFLGLDSLPEDSKIKGYYWVRTFCLGAFQIDVTIKPQQYCPKTSYVYEWGGKPYKTYSMVHFNAGIQEGIDKLFQLFILNGILTNNPSYKFPTGSIKDTEIDNWTLHINNPLIPKEYTPQQFGDKYFIPEREKVEPLSNFFPTILQMLKEAGEYIPGINPLMGDSRSVGIETSSTLQQYQASAYKKVKLALYRILAAEENNGNSLIEILIDKIDTKKLYPYFDTEEDDIKEMQVLEDQLKIMKYSNYYLMTIPWRGDSSQRQNMAREFMKIAQTSTDPAEKSLFIHEAIKLDELRGSKKLLEKLDVVKNTQAQIQSMKSQMDRMEELMKQMENKYIDAKQKEKIADATITMLLGIAKEEGKLQQLLLNQKPKEESNG